MKPSYTSIKNFREVTTISTVQLRAITA